jgi:hypothetical protein
VQKRQLLFDALPKLNEEEGVAANSACEFDVGKLVASSTPISAIPLSFAQLNRI